MAHIVIQECAVLSATLVGIQLKIFVDPLEQCTLLLELFLHQPWAGRAGSAGQKKHCCVHLSQPSYMGLSSNFELRPKFVKEIENIL